MRTGDDSAATDHWPRPRPIRRVPEVAASPPAAAADTVAAEAIAVDPSVPDLPGCRPISLPRRDLDTWDGRFEYWDGDTETAWVCEPTGLGHEQPAMRLAGLCSLIAAARGAPIECIGSTDLELRDEHGERRKILQADQCVYLYPERARLPEDGGIVVGEHDLPDVVLEVDHTTDVRRWKLGMYESWGFPEVWVEVPRRRSRSRSRRRRSGLTVHVLEGGRYRESKESLAFPGWWSPSIHDALNEAGPTGWTHARLKGVGRRLGERDGTGPDDHPFLRSFRDESRAEGLAEGEAKGWIEGRARTIRQMMLSRGIAVSEGFPSNVPGFAEASEEAAVAAAFACGSEQDYRARLFGGRLRDG